MTRYLITVSCHSTPDRYNNSTVLWTETGYRDASTPKQAAIMAGMPGDVAIGRRERLQGRTTAYYTEQRAADGTKKTWHAAQMVSDLHA